MNSESQRIRPQVHGHRGARGRRPENTLEGVSYAIQCGADAVEVDLCVSLDNIVVVYHDLTLSSDTTRHADNTWVSTPTPIRTLTFDQILQYNVGQQRPGTDYAKLSPFQIPIADARIPSLEQLIDTVLDQASEPFIFNLELKSNPELPELIPEPEQYAELVLNALERYEITHRTFVQSFDWRLIRLIKQHCPAMSSGVLTFMRSDSMLHTPASNTAISNLWTDGLNLTDFDHSIPLMVAATGATVWSTNFDHLTPDLVRQAKELGLSIITWTVNKIDDMNRMIDLGVDSITTDYPDVLVKLLDSKMTGQDISVRHPL